eukprot:1010283-Rhodomonas_salina.1
MYCYYALVPARSSSTPTEHTYAKLHAYCVLGIINTRVAHLLPSASASTPEELNFYQGVGPCKISSTNKSAIQTNNTR